MSETHTFKADISELMNLIINAFYSSKDVFLRELVSNASDALDKRRHADLLKQELDRSYEIKIETDEKEKMLTIQDNGIGMNREDLVNHLSTIAKSGTKEFIQQLKEKSDMIGQFGVGFYSAFLVADKVDVYTKKVDEPAYKWSSQADQVYSIEEIPDYESVGTRIVLYIKDDSTDFLKESVIRKIVGTHSQFITYPITLLVEKTYDVPLTDEEIAELESKKAEVEEIEETGEETKVEEIEETGKETKVEEIEDGEEEEAIKTKKETRKEWEKINGEKPLWYRKVGEPTKEEYYNLYKVISKDFQEPLFYRHFSTEGIFEFRGILYIPSHTPYNFLTDFSRDKRNVRLYVKKVLVLQQLEKDMMPDWMNFVTGVIDSSDMPLNVSREMLQQTKVLNAMKTQIKKQVMNMLNELVDNQELYVKFYEAFHKNLKLGIHEGDNNLLPFLRIACNEKDNIVTLDEYIDGHLQTDQKSIYYITGEDGDRSVFTKLYRDRNYSVLLFSEPIDEFMLQRITKYKDFDFVNISKEHTVPWEKEDEKAEDEESTKEFCEWFKKTLEDGSIDKVKISKTLTLETDTPCVVLSSKYGWTGNMEKLMKAQPLNDNSNMSFMKGRKIVELNANHPVIKKLIAGWRSEDEEAKTIQQTAQVVYQTSLISAGFPIENPIEYSRLVQTLLV